MSPFATLDLSTANANLALYNKAHANPRRILQNQVNRHPNWAIALTPDLMIALKRKRGTLELGVQDNQIVTVMKSERCVVRFFQAIANFFKGIDTNPARVELLREESMKVARPYAFKFNKACEYTKNELSAVKDQFNAYLLAISG